MGTHPIFESDFDCLTDILKMPFVQNYENLSIDNRGYYRDNRGFYICYVDGSCKGKGILFGNHPSREIAQSCDPNDPSTNNHAELKAALIAIRHARKYNLGRLQVRTDSQFLIDIIPHCKNGGNLVDHLARIINEILALKKIVQVEFVHIPAHCNG